MPPNYPKIRKYQKLLVDIQRTSGLPGVVCPRTLTVFMF